MVKMTVNYMIDEKEYERIKQINHIYKSQGLDQTDEAMFQGIMQFGSQTEIESRLRYHEELLGIAKEK